MRKGLAHVDLLLPFIFGVVITLIIFFTLIFPSISRVIFGACWGGMDNQVMDFRSTFARMDVDEEVQKEITLGDCIDKFIFTERGDLNSVAPDVTCDHSFRSMIVVVPRFQGIDKAVAAIKGLKAKCEEIPYNSKYADLTPNHVVLDGPEDKESTKTYCLTISKTATDSFLISKKEGDC